MPEELAEEPIKPKSGKKTLLFGLIAALLLGGGGGYAVYSGMLNFAFEEKRAKPKDAHAEHLKTLEYHPLEPIVVPLPGGGGRLRQLRVSLLLEVHNAKLEQVTVAGPRIRDSLQTYLRAVDERDLVEPKNMERLRAQMLRRVRLETPPEAVSDVLVSEFMFF